MAAAKQGGGIFHQAVASAAGDLDTLHKAFEAAGDAYVQAGADLKPYGQPGLRLLSLQSPCAGARVACSAALCVFLDRPSLPSVVELAAMSCKVCPQSQACHHGTVQ